LIRFAENTDVPFICDIYNYYIKNTIVTFEEEEVDEKEISERIKDITQKYPWIVYEENGIVVGYAYAAKWKDRNSYRFSAESTVYIHRAHLGKGIGRELMNRLIEEITVRGIHNLIAGIALPNNASVALTKKMGFVKCGLFREVGFKFGQWIDVEYWEKKL
jgi:phosphinothricin acetyltransferase